MAIPHIGDGLQILSISLPRPQESYEEQANPANEVYHVPNVAVSLFILSEEIIPELFQFSRLFSRLAT